MRMVKSSWEAEAQGHSRLDMLQRLLDTGCKLRCVDVTSKRVWRIVVKLRGGMAELRVETGGWCGLKREERLCKEYMQQVIENEEYFLLKCWSVKEEKEVMQRYLIESVERFQEMSDRLNIAVMLDYTCREERVGRMLEKM